jgi:hypothetical protein
VKINWMAVYLWHYSLLSEAIVGFSHAALVVLGGSAVTHDAPPGLTAGAPLSLHDLGGYCLIGSAIRIFNYLDDHPLPPFVSQTTTDTKTVVISSTKETTPTPTDEKTK